MTCAMQPVRSARRSSGSATAGDGVNLQPFAAEPLDHGGADP